MLKKIILIVVVIVVSYNSSGWCAGVRDWWEKESARQEYNNKHYWAASKCRTCFQRLSYLQEKGKPPAQAEAKCRWCGSVNKYLSDIETVCTHCRTVNRWPNVHLLPNSLVDECRKCGGVVVFHSPWRTK